MGLSKFSNALVEKQDIILNRLTDLSCQKSIKLMAGIVSNLEKLQSTEDIKCNKIIADQFLNDPRATFSKVEAGIFLDC